MQHFSYCGKLRTGAADRGRRKSRFKSPDSRVAPCEACRALVDRLRDFGTLLALEFRSCGPRGAAWSNIKPGRGFGLKKQTLSVCDLRNFKRDEEGTGGCKASRIAAERTVSSVVQISKFCTFMGVELPLIPSIKVSELGRQNFTSRKMNHMTKNSYLQTST